MRSSPRAGAVACTVLAALLLASCGGGGGAAPATGGGLVLLTFEQDARDDLPLNSILVWRFSAPLDPATVGPASFQLREGAGFGLSVPGSFAVDGAVVTFEPKLPGRCDLSDGTFQPDTRYRVQIIGLPNALAVRSADGDALDETVTRSFSTRPDTGVLVFDDQVSGAPPTVVDALPADGSAAVAVTDGNRIVLTLSENLQPCSVDTTSVRFEMHQTGDPALFVAADGGAGLATGFVTDVGGATADQTPQDPLTWTTAASQALVRTLDPPQTVPARIELEQSFTETRLVITPAAGRFPENALLVVRVTDAVEDYGGTALEPFTLAFTTQNLPPQDHVFTVDTRGETPWDLGVSTARITETAPGLVQGRLLFAGDGDNGTNLLANALPQSDAGTCDDDYQADDGAFDHFDPVVDVLLDTGSSPNTCANATDGSFGVVWEFKSFRIRSGVTVRIVGVNPAILLSQGDVVIEAGGRLLVRGDGLGGAPQSDGEGDQSATTTAGTQGGTGVAGGGDGGSSPAGQGTFIPPRYGGHGVQGYYHDATGALGADVGTAGGTGGGHGNTSARWNEQANPNNRNTPSGGGGGHATQGVAGTALGSGSTPTSLDDTPDGAAGATYGDGSGHLRTPEAGSGGGAGGELRPFQSNIGRGPGGAGAAGGGFVDLTSSGDIVVLGTIDASGGRGGSNPGGMFDRNYAWNPGTGGGGGGSGGGIRLLTPERILFGDSTVISAAGGAGGAGGASNGTNPPLNNGGAGGVGRVALEDGDSIINGLANASITPSEGSTGFYRGAFDGTRFQGGGTRPVAISEIFALGPFAPLFHAPTAGDFVATVPAAASPGVGKTVMLLEVRGYRMRPDGLPDTTGVIEAPTAWHTVGHVVDSGVETAPTFVAGQPPLADIGGALPDGNTGLAGIELLDGRAYVQLRVTLFLDPGTVAGGSGPALDVWRIRSTSDQ